MSKIWLSFVSYPVTTAVYFERAFRKKHEVKTVGPELPEVLIKEWKLENLKLPITPQDIPTGFGEIDIFSLYSSVPENERPEYFIWIESVPGFFPKTVNRLPVPTAAYFIDTHLHLEEHVEKAKSFDFVFIAQREYLPEFEKAGIKNVFWLPLAADPEIHRKFSDEKKYDIGFVGSLYANPRRENLLNKLKEKFPLHYERSFWTEMAKTLGESKIVFNNAVRNDLNMRVFETLGVGSFLLTDFPKKSAQDELFVNHEDLAVYKDPFIENVVRFYLERDELREAIAARGHELVLNAHKYSDRAEELLDVLSGKRKRTSTARELREKSVANVSVPTVIINKLKRSFVIPVIDYSPASEFNIKTLLDDLEKIEGETIVVFNSEQVADELKNDPRIDQYAIMKNNVGVSRAWNIGLHVSRTPITFIINSDVHVEKETIAALEDALISLPKAATAGPQGSFFHFDLAQDIQYFDKGTFGAPQIVDAVSGFLFGVRTEYFQNGTLVFEDAYTPAYFEEWDLGLQIKKAKLFSYIVPATAYEHHWSGSIRSMEKIKFYDNAETPQEILARNRKIFHAKWRKIAQTSENKTLLVSAWINWILETSKIAIEKNDYDKAEKIFKLIIELYPALEVGYKNLGILYFVKKEFHKAKPYFEQVLKLNPNDETAKQYLGAFNE